MKRGGEEEERKGKKKEPLTGKPIAITSLSGKIRKERGREKRGHSEKKKERQKKKKILLRIVNPPSSIPHKGRERVKEVNKEKKKKKGEG